MNGKEGSFGIKISSNEGKLPETRNKFKVWMYKIWEFAKEDINRVTFSLKVGLAVLLVSLLILFQAPYQVFSTSIIWSILTVAIMFEYTVGATFHKGFNRVLGSLFAGVLAIAIAELALMSGPVAEPIIIGISIFIIGSVTSFMKLWPTFVPYEYGFRVILFTYCLIIVSGYRSGNPIRTSIERLYSIAIGAIIAIAVNTLIFPIWAGEQLHKELVKSFNSVADSLEECVNKYLSNDGSDHSEFTNTLMDEFPDEPQYKKCRSTLNSSAKLESLALSAKWEPPHGRFRHLFYPWSEYVKVGAVLRYCAYEVMALHGVLHSEIQAPYNLRSIFETEISEATNKAADLIRCLGKDICDMKQTIKSTLVRSVRSSSERLQRAIETHAYLLASSYQLSDHNSSIPLPINGFSKSNQLAEFKRENEEEGEMNSQRILSVSWESTAALSLATFTSLLIEFVARLDHLVEAVHHLSQMAKFQHESL
ncbi:aluminum-activated malate transporter 9 isoform X1 [Lactuca sativa]|uniref:aluminum-activated malate transporter 9 isoform X1 n=1 Tax=Lactuca sativa TaxID=4236 RepID=UPI000CB22F97|nr:aluminum-activated malate transporter 9 isoform X1 [Lactuca sativa]